MYEQTEAEAKHTNNAGLLDSQFYFNFGVSAEQSGLYDRAATLLEKSLTMEDDPRQIANASNYLGFMWVDHDQNLERGGDLIKKAVELEPDNGAYLDSLGWYYYKTSRFPDALAQLQLAIEKLNPGDPVVYEHLGDTYLKLNDISNALGSIRSTRTRWRSPRKLLTRKPASRPSRQRLRRRVEGERVVSSPADHAGSVVPVPGGKAAVRAGKLSRTLCALMAV